MQTSNSRLSVTLWNMGIAAAREFDINESKVQSKGSMKMTCALYSDVPYLWKLFENRQFFDKGSYNLLCPIVQRNVVPVWFQALELMNIVSEGTVFNNASCILTPVEQYVGVLFELESLEAESMSAFHFMLKAIKTWGWKGLMKNLDSKQKHFSLLLLSLLLLDGLKRFEVLSVWLNCLDYPWSCSEKKRRVRVTVYEGQVIYHESRGGFIHHGNHTQRFFSFHTHNAAATPALSSQLSVPGEQPGPI